LELAKCPTLLRHAIAQALVRSQPTQQYDMLISWRWVVLSLRAALATPVQIYYE
jgi:hypothetical protein